MSFRTVSIVSFFGIAALACSSGSKGTGSGTTGPGGATFSSAGSTSTSSEGSTSIGSVNASTGGSSGSTVASATGGGSVSSGGGSSAASSAATSAATSAASSGGTASVGSGSTSSSGTSGSGGPTAPGKIYWIIGSSELAELVALDDGGNGALALAQAYFNNSKTYISFDFVDLTPLPAVLSQFPQAIPTSHPTAWGVSPPDGGCPSAPGLQDIVADGGFTPGIGAALLDEEGWCYTPRAEWGFSPPFLGDAAAAILDAGKQFLLTGPTDSAAMGNLAQLPPTNLPTLFDLQIQEQEIDAGAYLQRVAAMAQSVRGTLPNAIILAGIATDPNSNGGFMLVNPDQLLAVITETLGTQVAGYWINFSEANPGNPQVLLALLQQLEENN